jgi:polyphosphate kinase
MPYESFEPVVRLIDQAADDPAVLAIKMILYRTSRNSPIVAALERASESGKHVTALVELKARFDEARNIGWAKALEQAGVQVIYGVKGLKTHAKVCIIIRREARGIQRYVHFATGNYNEVTAKLYCDVGFLTCDEELAADATSFFNAISGFSVPQQYRKIAAAPFLLRDRVLELIDGEIDRRERGQRAHIMAQVNSLSDPKLIQALYRASRAGVRIDLNVRGICCLRPGVPELSDNIRVTSILDRYLEHSRILYFYHGGAELVYISSADWMLRNLDKRVELLVPVEDTANRQRLIAILKSYTRDNVKGRRLLADGTYQRQRPGKDGRKHRHQEHLYRLASEAEKMLEQSQRTVFRPHRAAGKEE